MATNPSITTVAPSLSLPLGELDPDVATAVDAELHRQQSTLEMIASENFAPAAVTEANSALDGKQSEDRLRRIGITVNRNAVPFDPRPPMVSSGLRIGTPALAARGFGEAEFRKTADIIARALKDERFGDEHAGLPRARVEKRASAFPLYPHLPHVNGDAA
jgi:glycine/serine hydroxymethyltransferase